ncbi:MAG: hypothetical protein M1839_002386 [Geoglossum umbratile]|nr:MAG: hypothetical protein M1839_002386 [Geoglossum umbratile]
MSDEVWAIETAFELNDIPNERWQDDASLRSSAGNIRCSGKPSMPHHRQGTTDVIFDPVGPGDFLTNAIDMHQSTEVMYREFGPDLTSVFDRNLPRLDEAYAVQSRDCIAQPNAALRLAARQINHHIAGNAFAAMAHNRRKAVIAQGLDHQESRQRLFWNAVGSDTAPLSIATVDDSAQASFTLGSPFTPPLTVAVDDAVQVSFTPGSPFATPPTAAVDDAVRASPTSDSPAGHRVGDLSSRSPRLYSGNDPMVLVEPIQLLRSPSNSSISSSALGSAGSGGPTSQRHQRHSDNSLEAIHKASPVSPAASEFTHPHIRLRELTRLSLLVDLDSMSKGGGGETVGHPGEGPRPASPKPMSIRQRQELVRTKLTSRLGQNGSMSAAEAEGNTDIGGNCQTQGKEGGWWSKLVQCFRRRKGDV